MNRKTKLFFSLVSLCFSIAVLCFGVYSAMQVSYTVSGSVSYEVTDAFVEITTNVYASSERMEQSTLNSNAQNLEDPTYVNTYTKVGDTYTYNSMEELSETNQPQASGIEINYNNYYTYFIVINIKNLSSDVNIYALIKEDIAGIELNSNVYNTEFRTGIIKPQTGDNVGKNIVLGFSLNDATTGVNSDFDYTLQVNAGEPQAATIDVVALDNTNIVTNADFNGSSYTFDVTSTSPEHMIVYGCTTWLYNITLEDIDVEYYNALLITVNTDQVVYGMGVVDRHVTQDDDPLELFTGLAANTDTFSSNISITTITQNLCFAIGTDNISGVHSTITLSFTNQIIDEENKLKFTQINNGTELSVSALNDTISGVVTIPSSYNGLPVTLIESGAASFFQDKHVDGFAYCNNITAIIIPETVREIASLAFRSCSNLFVVAFQDNSQLKIINRTAFEYCETLEGFIIIEDDLGNVKEYYSLPKSLESIGEYAFANCSSLSSITIPSSVTSIGEYAFRYCDALETVTFEDADSVWVLSDTLNTEISITEHTPQVLATYLTNNYSCSYTWTKKQSA